MSDDLTMQFQPSVISNIASFWKPSLREKPYHIGIHIVTSG